MKYSKEEVRSKTEIIRIERKVSRIVFNSREFDQELGQNVKLAREKIKMSQLNLAYSIGRTPMTMCRMENGSTSICVDDLMKISLTCGVGILELIPTLEE